MTAAQIRIACNPMGRATLSSPRRTTRVGSWIGRTEDYRIHSQLAQRPGHSIQASIGSPTQPLRQLQHRLQHRLKYTAAPTEEDTDATIPIIIIAVCVGLGLIVCVGGYMYYQQMLAQEAAIKAENAKEALEKKKQDELEALKADFDAANAAYCGAGYVFNGCASGPEVPEHLAESSPSPSSTD